MQKYKMVIAYDGTAYHGWQVQSFGISVQICLQQALQTILRENIGISASGRTDAGVHAKGQVAHFCYARELDPFRFIRSINAVLPFDIRVRSIEAVSEDFHARYSAKSKIYHYHLLLGAVADPFQRLYAYHVRHDLDVQAMYAGAKLFVGTHDFKSFAHAASQGVAAHDSIRTLTRVDIIATEQQVRIEFEGDGFLYKMVRNIVGTLLEVGSGKRAIETISHLLLHHDRSLAGTTARAHGLFLMHVNYD